ncbi:MAG TPA: Uma2 family endonuclease [Longimicrobium sp.]|nr:Uma2 family endonuclease [Longimicrobium sp.]
MATKLLTTAEELLRMPRDGLRRELVDGAIREMSPAEFDHGRVAANVALELAIHVRAAKLGTVVAAETGFRLATNPDTVLAPDAAFVSHERAESVAYTRGYFPGAPDLAVEVVSPGDRARKVEAKAFAWIDAGTRMVIVLHPRRRTATVYRGRGDIVVLGEGDTLDGGDVVPGWSVPVRDLFA